MHDVIHWRVLYSFVIVCTLYIAVPIHAASTFVVADYDAVRNLNPATVSAGDAITVTDEHIAGDFAVRSGTVPDNGGTLIEIGTGNSLYAQRIYSGPIDVRWFGAKGDDSADDTDAIQDALDLKQDVHLPPGVYRITDSIVVPIVEGMKITGAGQELTKIKNVNTSGADAVRLIGTGSSVGTRVAYVELSDMTISGNAQSGHGVFTDLAYENTFRKLRLIGHGNTGKSGLYIKRGFYSEIVRITAQSNGQDGVHLGETANGNIILNSHFGGGLDDGNGRAGVYIGSDGGTARTHGCQVIGNIFESNDEYNLYIDEADTCLIAGNYLEATSGDGTTAQLAVTSTGQELSLGNIIRDNDFTGDVLSIHLDEAKGTVISGNDINYGLTLADGADRTTIVQNTFVQGTVTDNGSDTILEQDYTQSDRWYRRYGTEKRYELIVNASDTDINYNGSYPVVYRVNGVEVLRMLSSGNVKWTNLPSSNPGTGTKQIWYDPNDGNRVKFSP